MLLQNQVEDKYVPIETRPYIDETVSYDGYPQNAEKVNGRWAMVGFVTNKCLRNNGTDHSWNFLIITYYFYKLFTKNIIKLFKIKI